MQVFLQKLKALFFSSPNKQRYITALLLIAILTLVLFLNYKALTWAILGALFILGVKESFGLFKIEGVWHFYAFCALLWVGAYFSAKPLYCGFFVLLLYASYLAYTRKISPKMLLPFIYPTLPFLCIWEVYINLDRLGLISLIMIVALTDTGAYFGGKAFGRTPFCPTSPKKTIEGVIVGVLCGVIVGSVFFIGFFPNFALALVGAFVVSVLAVFGDLFESYLKRVAQIKDSGGILPGHGGILDRVDAILFSAIGMQFVLSFFA
ncbi:phosphatidate cytidylyltransferase [Helicobacter himalayensis]|uniref:phosphatidate cytidylyltransferase n=1 Tax=Helicobacter himalayensis TaxID=1591088 RepID=UPI003D6E9AE3